MAKCKVLQLPALNQDALQYAYHIWNDKGPCLESAIFVQQQPERTRSSCPTMSPEQDLVHEMIYRSFLYRLENLEEFPEKESMP